MGIPGDTRIRDAEAAWAKVHAAKETADRAISIGKLASEDARRLAKAAQDYIAALDRLVLH
jgi:hypothetical protein